MAQSKNHSVLDAFISTCFDYTFITSLNLLNSMQDVCLFVNNIHFLNNIQ